MSKVMMSGAGGHARQIGAGDHAGRGPRSSVWLGWRAPSEMRISPPFDCMRKTAASRAALVQPPLEVHQVVVR